MCILNRINHVKIIQVEDSSTINYGTTVNQGPIIVGKSVGGTSVLGNGGTNYSSRDNIYINGAFIRSYFT